MDHFSSDSKAIIYQWTKVSSSLTYTPIYSVFADEPKMTHNEF